MSISHRCPYRKMRYLQRKHKSTPRSSRGNRGLTGERGDTIGGHFTWPIAKLASPEYNNFSTLFSASTANTNKSERNALCTFHQLEYDFKFSLIRHIAIKIHERVVRTTNNKMKRKTIWEKFPVKCHDTEIMVVANSAILFVRLLLYTVSITVPI